MLLVVGNLIGITHSKHLILFFLYFSIVLCFLG